MFIDSTSAVQSAPPTPLWLQREASQRAHALENACGLINSISGGKTRLHPSHVVQENSLETCRRIAYKPPLGRMLLKTCDHKCVVVPDVIWQVFFAPHSLLHRKCTLTPNPMVDVESKKLRLGSQICHRAANTAVCTG